MRCAAVDASTGRPVNLYPLLHAATTINAPTSPWAVNLTSHDGAYRLLAFDLDAKNHCSAVQDADRLSSLLTRCKIPHLICSSGPSHGRHVWVGLREGQDASTVTRLVRALRLLLPALDPAPLSNPATGCVRPPGSPHRHGGTSTVLAGDIRALTEPTTTTYDIQALIAVAEAQLSTLTRMSTTPTSGRSATATSTTAGMGRGPQDDAPGTTRSRSAPTLRAVQDAGGHLHLPGPRGPLPGASQEALRTDTTGTDHDASSTLWRVLIGAAATHWRYDDITALLAAPATPGLEHARSRRASSTSSGRVPRPRRGPDSPASVLSRQWHRAVAWAAANPRTGAGSDDSFPERAGDIVDIVETLQDHADACPGRWSHGSGPAGRRVLDTLCLYALQSVQHSVEADIRRIALQAGIGRETARLALQRLTSDGWITQAFPAIGPRGAIWSLTRTPPAALIQTPDATEQARLGARPDQGQKLVHSSCNKPGHKRSRAPQAPLLHVPRPTGPVERLALLGLLAGRLAASTHDALGPTSPGLALGNVLGRLASPVAGPTNSEQQTSDPYIDAMVLRLNPRHLAHAIAEGLVFHEGDRLQRHVRASVILDRMAVHNGTYGRLALREAAYILERELWSWWCAEQAWMTASRPAQRARPGPEQMPLWAEPARDRAGEHRRHPRTPSGRADFVTARALLTASALSH